LTFVQHTVIVIAHVNHRVEEMEYLLALDRAIFLWINNQWANPVLDIFFLIITWLGNGWIVIAMVGIFFALQKPAYLRQHLPWLGAVLLVGGLCVYGIKKMVPRPRPLTDFVPLIEAGKVHIHVLGEQLRYRSFPSGDTQTAFTAATYFSFLFPRWAPLLLFLATAVGFSRIYKGVHFPIDVIAGSLVGGLLGLVAWLPGKRHDFSLLFTLRGGR
jgi:undecaprenyl-diphosphatase